MFDYLFGVLATLIASTTALVGFQQHAQPEVAPYTTEQSRQVMRETLSDEDGRPETIDDVLADIDAAPTEISYDDFDSQSNTRERNTSPDELKRSFNDLDERMRSLSDDSDDDSEGEDWEDDEEDDEDEDDGDRRWGGGTLAPVVQPVQKVVPAKVTTPTVQPAVKSVSRATLAQHNSARDCWVVFQGSVYDITAIVPWHPGGAGALTPHCGAATGFESAFAGQHGSSQVSNLLRRASNQGKLQ